MSCYNFKIRLRGLCNLIFFVFHFYACSEKSSEIQIRWTGDRATGLLIPEGVVKNPSGNSEQHITVHLIASPGSVSMLGNFRKQNGDIIFEPLVPFTRGLSYEVRADGNPVGEIEIPAADAADAPQLVNIYPTQDTVPENLLKIYLQFSNPMREGVSANHVILLRNDADTIKGAFLDLQPELWNEDRTLLTLWLDPGRIKRDLIPNKTLGTPLQQGSHYTFIVDGSWQDTQGSTLPGPYHKLFFVLHRDSLSPDPRQWNVYTPAAGTSEELDINLGSALDYSLLNTTLRIENERHEFIAGQWGTGDEEKNILFLPEKSWERGKYTLLIQTRLEDLAGNNINRLFEVDVRTETKSKTTADVVTISFEIN